MTLINRLQALVSPATLWASLLMFPGMFAHPVWAAQSSCLFEEVQLVNETLLGGEPRISGNGMVVVYECTVNYEDDLGNICIKDYSISPPIEEMIESGEGVRFGLPNVSDDGNVVLYQTKEGGQPELVYVYYRDTDQIELVTVDPQGSPLATTSPFAVISGNGRYVLFNSYSDDYVEADQNNEGDLFRRDLQLDETIIVSLANDGSQGTAWNRDYYPGVSADGNVITFWAESPLVPSDDNEEPDVYVRNVLEGTTRLVGTRTNGAGLYYGSYMPGLSGDGTVAAFMADDDVRPYWNLYARELGGSGPERLSIPVFGGDANNHVPHLNNNYVDISYDGRFVTFNSKADGLVEGDNNSGNIYDGLDSFIRDRHRDVTRLLSWAPDGSGGCERADGSTNESMDNSGTWFAYQWQSTVYRASRTDLDPPEIEVSLFPKIGSSLATFSPSARVTDLNITTDVQLRLDNNPWQSADSKPWSSNSIVTENGSFKGTGLALGSHSLCYRAFDKYGNEGQSCVEFTIQEDPAINTQMTVRCTHSPLVPAPGDEVTYLAEVISNETGDLVKADQVEIWVNDNAAPALVGDLISSLTITREADGEFVTYGCRAEDSNRNVAVFSGWRLHATSDWSVTRPLPIAKTGFPENRLDIVFVPDLRTYDSYRDPDFLSAVEELMRNGYWASQFFRARQNWFNFWIAPDMGSAESSEDGCDHYLPGDISGGFPGSKSLWEIYYGFVDTAALVHADEFRDCAPGGRQVFSTDLGNTGTIRHETGHRPFGMPDEYADDGGYYVISPYPTLYANAQDCEDDLPNLDDTDNVCTSFVDVDGVRWWRSDPEDDHLMNDRGTPRAADRRRMEWMFRKCEKGEC